MMYLSHDEKSRQIERIIEYNTRDLDEEKVEGFRKMLSVVRGPIFQTPLPLGMLYNRYRKSVINMIVAEFGDIEFDEQTIKEMGKDWADETRKVAVKRYNNSILKKIESAIKSITQK